MSSVKHREVTFSEAELAEEPPKEIDFSRVRVLGRGQTGIEAARRLSRSRRLAHGGAGQAMRLREYTVIISEDVDGWLYGTVAELQGCHSQAKTMPSLLKRIKQAIEACMDDKGKPDTQASRFVGVQRVALNG